MFGKVAIDGRLGDPLEMPHGVFLGVGRALLPLAREPFQHLVVFLVVIPRRPKMVQ